MRIHIKSVVFVSYASICILIFTLFYYFFSVHYNYFNDDFKLNNQSIKHSAVLSLKQIQNEKKIPFFVTDISKKLSLSAIPLKKKHRLIIISEARSGSSFVGDLLQQAWPSFYIFEQCTYFGDTVTKLGEHDKKEAIDNLKELFLCNGESFFDSKSITLFFKEKTKMMERFAKGIKGRNKFLKIFCLNIFYIFKIFFFQLNRKFLKNSFLRRIYFIKHSHIIEKFVHSLSILLSKKYAFRLSL
jgi:hypothetical protein